MPSARLADEHDRARERGRDVDFLAQQERALAADHVADDAAEARRDDRHHDGDERPGARLEPLAGADHAEERQPDRRRATSARDSAIPGYAR